MQHQTCMCLLLAASSTASARGCRVLPSTAAASLNISDSSSPSTVSAPTILILPCAAQSSFTHLKVAEHYRMQQQFSQQVLRGRASTYSSTRPQLDKTCVCFDNHAYNSVMTQYQHTQHVVTATGQAAASIASLITLMCMCVLLLQSCGACRNCTVCGL